MQIFKKKEATPEIEEAKLPRFKTIYTQEVHPQFLEKALNEVSSDYILKTAYWAGTGHVAIFERA
jgi:L-aminopeptidase/D-esterase-like protein